MVKMPAVKAPASEARSAVKAAGATKVASMAAVPADATRLSSSSDAQASRDSL